MQSASQLLSPRVEKSKPEVSGNCSDGDSNVSGDYDRWDVSSRHSGELEQDSKTHLALHRVIRIAKPHSACSSPRSDIEEIENGENAQINENKLEKISKNPPFSVHTRGCGPIDSKKYCKDCNRGFATVGSYTRHLRMIHYKLRPLNCDVCGHAFYQRSDLKKHIQRQHQKHQSDSSLNSKNILN